jgi:hypothetical protein
LRIEASNRVAMAKMFERVKNENNEYQQNEQLPLKALNKNVDGNPGSDFGQAQTSAGIKPVSRTPNPEILLSTVRKLSFYSD